VSRRLLGWLALFLIGAALLGWAARNPTLRHEAQVLLGMEPRPQITPLAVVLPSPAPTAAEPPASPTVAPSQTPPPPPPTGTSSAAPTAPPSPTASPSPTAPPAATATPAPVVIGGRVYTAYIPAALKEGQQEQYTCEFDAVWVILQSYGIDASVEEIIARTAIDSSVEPWFEETAEGFVIHGGDIRSAFSGDYRENFLARSTGGAMQPVFASYGLEANPVSDRAGVEAALQRGALVWMKTTVDFKPWRPATWITPSGERLPTVLGNDHAVVAIGFNQDVVVIRDVLGPTSSNWQRPYEYEVDWATFLASWGAQGFDGLAVEWPGA
jgi:uncharacterized protein YvpB